MRPGGRLSDIGYAVQRHAEQHGFSVVREFSGHGIGTSLHEEPQVPNYGAPGKGPKLRPGLVLAIEPMVNAGKPGVKMDAGRLDGADGRRVAVGPFRVLRGGDAERGPGPGPASR